MARAKTQKTDLSDITLSVSAPAPSIDVDALTAKITEAVTKKLTVEFEGKMQVALQKISTASEQRRDRIVLTGAKPYAIDASDDGLLFSKENDVVLLVGKNGQLATGTKSPRSFGKGSAHFRSGYTSEADLPTSGNGSTRGVIVEGDGDDDKTFVFRAVSRMNRQGTNVFSDGSVAIGSMNKVNDATLGVYHRFNDTDAVSIDIPTLEYDHTAVSITAATPLNNRWNAFNVIADEDTETFRVDGTGSVYANGSYYSNGTCYAELFEWADGNSRGEDRNGFTVTLDANGKLRVADEGDKVVGVVVPHAAVVGNSAWNHWHSKFRDKQNKYSIVEWLEIETTKLKSFYKHSLSKDFALPDNAIEIQTDYNGNEFFKSSVNHLWDSSEDYVGREKRKNWAVVCILGSAPVFKGQLVNNNWIKVKDLNDELELMIIK
jgi:hypothetical protein